MTAYLWTPAELERLLGSGMSTDQIAGELGVQYATILRRLQRNGYDSLRQVLLRKRHEEWQRRVASGIVDMSRPICEHGYYVGQDGVCTHGIPPWGNPEQEPWKSWEPQHGPTGHPHRKARHEASTSREKD